MIRWRKKAPEPQPQLVQCSRCPIIMTYQREVALLHFKEAHGIDGFSIRPIEGTDWDIRELLDDESIT